MSRAVIAVLNIGWTCTKHELRNHFKKYGTVYNVQIPMDQESGMNKKIAFVRLSGQEGYTDKILKDYHVIDGYEVTVQMAVKNLDSM